MTEYVNLPISEALKVFDGLELTDRETLIASRDPARDPRSAALPERRRRRLPDARPQRRDAVGRRRAAHPARDADRLEPDRRALRPRRAVDRAAPARQPRAALDAGAAARSRQHRRRRRARRGDDPVRRLRHRPRPRRRRARRPADLPGHAGEAADGRQRIADRRPTSGASCRSRRRSSGARRRGDRSSSRARARTTSRTSTSRSRSAC